MAVSTSETNKPFLLQCTSRRVNRRRQTDLCGHILYRPSVQTNPLYYLYSYTIIYRGIKTEQDNTSCEYSHFWKVGISYY